MGGDTVPYGPLQPDTWVQLATQAGIWARLTERLTAHRQRIRTATTEPVEQPGNEHTERCLVCLTDIDPAENPRRW
eukprot:11213212-Lingulodinium_polyedra.AAC.1